MTEAEQFAEIYKDFNNRIEKATKAIKEIWKGGWSYDEEFEIRGDKVSCTFSWYRYGETDFKDATFPLDWLWFTQEHQESMFRVGYQAGIWLDEMAKREKVEERKKQEIREEAQVERHERKQLKELIRKYGTI